MKTALAAACLPLILLAGASSAQAATSRMVADRYGDLSDRLEGDTEVEAWYEAMRGLRIGFDEICGDTFCEGDYSNIQPLRFTCSVAGSERRIGQCVWTFAASHEEIDAASGRITVKPKAWRCRLPIASGTTAQAMIAALAQERPLYAVLPGTSTSIYQALGDCL